MDKTQKQQEIHCTFSQKIQELQRQQDDVQNKQRQLSEAQDEFCDFRTELQILIENIKISYGEAHANWLYEYEQELSDEYRKIEAKYVNEREALEQERKRLYQLEDKYYKEKEQQLILLDKE
ncbi:MAG: hypothetical protein J6K53_02565 [Roseburia sp.]|nr:hypothetical protein [Roseburia sp.]